MLKKTKYMIIAFLMVLSMTVFGLPVSNLSLRASGSELMIKNEELQPNTIKVKKRTSKSNPLEIFTHDKTKLSIKKVFKISGAVGTVTYTKLSGDPGIKVNSKTGKITVKKGLKAGIYKVRIKVAASGNLLYSKGNVTAAVYMKVNETNNEGEESMSNMLPKGKWCDVNGSTVLEFNGNKLHITWWEGDFEGETFNVKLNSGEYYDEIINTDTDSYGEFGIMGKLSYQREEETISAYEMILDAEGHKYLFVPENRLEEERSVKDFSEECPKSIESDELDRFSLSLRHYHPDGLDSGNYSFTLLKDPDGFYNYEFEGMGDSYVIIQYKTQVDNKFAKGLAAILKDDSILMHNGEFFSDRESNIEYSLYARFISKEKISIKVGNTALDKWNIDEKAILDYALKIIPKKYRGR